MIPTEWAYRSAVNLNMAENLPQGYMKIASWNIDQVPGWFLAVLIVFSLAALALTVGIVGVVVLMIKGLSTESDSVSIRLGSQQLLLGLLLAPVLTVVLHEMFHGIVFRAFGARPRFGFKLWTRFGPVFYTAAPGSYLRRAEFLAVGLAPLTLLTLVLVAVLLILPSNNTLYFAVWLATGLNVGGSVGDLYFVRKILSFPRECFFEDREDGFTVFGLNSSTHEQAKQQ